MATEIAMGDLIPPIILLILTALLSIIFITKRRRTNVTALDWLIAVFVTMSLMGILELLKLYFIDSWAIFYYASNEHSLPVEPVRFLHMSVLIILYLMSEQFLGDHLNSKRIIIVTALLSIYGSLGIYFVTTGNLIFMDEIFSFGQHITMDSVVFDTFQLFTSSLLLYVYVAQINITHNVQIKKFLAVLISALIIFVISSILEIVEAFVAGFEINGFLTSIPTFLIIAYFYIRFPNFVYLAPSKVQFLQIISRTGQLLYAAELKDDLDTSDFLIAPSLTGVNTLLGELVGKKNLKVEQFEYEGGNILFEQVGDIQIILQTDRPAGILKRSMRYFLRVFNTEFSSQIENYKGYIGVNDKNISPDDVLRQCIPIVQSKALTSSYHVKEEAK